MAGRVRLDPAALVRLRPAGADRQIIWGRVPWGVMVCRTVPATGARDVTVPAGELLERLTAGRDELPAPRDAQWRWALPASAGEAVESVPVADLVRLGGAPGSTLASGAGRIGERMLRDALLDHVAIEVRTGDRTVEVRQGLVQALLRMGFVTVRMQGTVTVRTLSNWLGLEASTGQVWIQNRASFAISILR